MFGPQGVFVVRSLTKSPVALCREALAVAQEALPSYSSSYSRKEYTQHQLFAILVVRQFFRTDYRGICRLLEDLSDLREVLGLKKVPHYSTLCYAEKRLLKKGPWTICSPPYSSAPAMGKDWATTSTPPPSAKCAQKNFTSVFSLRSSVPYRHTSLLCRILTMQMVSFSS